MNTRLKQLTLSFLGLFGIILISVTSPSCKKDKQEPLASTPLYDTLGWFIQGGTGAVEGNGTKMVNDPDHPGQTVQAGRLAIRTVVNKAILTIAADNELNVYFPTLLAEVSAGNTTGFSHLLETFTDFVQQAVSGQQIYHGKSMVEAHDHATYSRFGDDAHPTSDNADFDRFIMDVGSAATSLSVPQSVIAQLAALLETTRMDIVH